MKLEFIPLDKLVVSKANMRYGRKAPDVSDILPTVRSRGVIQPVIVRPNCAPDGYEIIAGSRRFHAAKIVAEERRAARDGDTEVDADADTALLPCAILDAGDDADDPNSIRSVINVTGRAIIPSREADRPHLQFVRWHREHCFKA